MVRRKKAEVKPLPKTSPDLLPEAARRAGMSLKEYEQYYAREMEVFDSLPPDIRQKLADCPYGFDAAHFKDWWIAEGLGMALDVLDEAQSSVRQRVQNELRELGCRPNSEG